MKRSRDQVKLVEHRMFEYLSEQYDLTFATTENFAQLDGVLMKNNKIHRICEVKVRFISLAQLKDMGSLLISYNKLQAGRDASRAFQAPFVILLYLVESDNIVSIKMTNRDGEFISGFKKEVTRTDYNIYGGYAHRMNAFVELTRMSLIK